MADYVIPDPEPKEIDEKLAIELRHLAENAVLRGHPSDTSSARTACTTWRTPPRSRTAGTPSSASWWARLVVPVVGEDPRVGDRAASRRVVACADDVPGRGVGDGQRRPAGDPGGGGARRPRAGRAWWCRTRPRSGRDAGELAYIAPLGVAATDDTSVALADDVDAVVYTATADTRPDDAFADLIACLEAGRQRGVDVLLSAAAPGERARADDRGRRTRPARTATRSVFVSGIDPGWALDILPVL